MIAGKLILFKEINEITQVSNAASLVIYPINLQPILFLDKINRGSTNMKNSGNDNSTPAPAPISWKLKGG